MKDLTDIGDLTDLVKSSVRDIEDFERSTVYADQARVLADWEAGLKVDYDKAENFEDVCRLQGISIAIEYLKRLPEAMKNIASLREKDKEG